MKRISLLGLLACAPLLAQCSSGSLSAPLPPSPQAGITALTQAFTAAWNVHDAQAFALTFAPDADFTNVYGVHAHGRAAIEAFHAQVFATVFKASHQSADSIVIGSLNGSSATVSVKWSMTGATIPGWPPLQHGTIAWTLVQQPDGSWLIGIMTNTLST